MTAHPIRISLASDSELQIDWSDGERRVYRFQEFLDNCPCASCREKRNQPPKPKPIGQLSILSAAEAQPLKLQQMTPIGNYAYAIRFNQGCPHGIFRFEALKDLGRQISGSESEQ